MKTESNVGLQLYCYHVAFISPISDVTLQKYTLKKNQFDKYAFGDSDHGCRIVFGACDPNTIKSFLPGNVHFAKMQQKV